MRRGNQFDWKTGIPVFTSLGPAGQVLISELKEKSQCDKNGDKLTQDEADALSAAAVLTQAPPREIAVNTQKPMRWLFTDAACEEHGEKITATVGGAMIDQHGKPYRFFSEHVPTKIMDLWKGVRQPITYAESLAALIGKRIWLEELVGHHVVVAVDNVAAQHTLVRYSSSSRLLRSVLRAHLLQDATSGLRVWVTWVPSESNLGDAPSRMKCDELKSLGAPQDEVDAGTWDELLRMMSLSALDTATEFVQNLRHKEGELARG